MPGIRGAIASIKIGARHSVHHQHHDHKHQAHHADAHHGKAYELKAEPGFSGALEFENDPELKSFPVMKKAVDRLKLQRKDTFDEIVKTAGVPQDIYLDYVKTEIDTEASCLELPLTIVVLLSFSILILNLLHQEQVYALEEAYEFDIYENANFAFSGNMGHKGIYDANSIADFWSWARLGFLALMVQPTWVYSEAMPDALGGPITAGTNYSVSHLPQQWLFQGYEKPAPVANDYLRYGKIVGGLRFRQKVIPADTSYCSFPSSIDVNLLSNWLGKPCVPSDLGLLTPELQDAEDFANMERVQYLFPDLEDVDEMKRVLIDMEDGCNRAAAIDGNLESCRCTWCKEQTPRQPWLDEQTGRVEISFIIFNAQYGLYTYVSVNFMFNRGGHIYKFIHCMSAFVDPLMRPVQELIISGMAAMCWTLALLWVAMNELKEVVHIIRSSGTGCLKALWYDYLGFWNVVDWTSILVGSLAGLYWLTMRFTVTEVNELLPDMVSAGLNPGSREEYQAIAEKFFLASESMALAVKDCGILFIMYPLIIMLRLFKSFQAQPRLAIVTATLKTAAPDLAHFFLVFLCVFICFFVNSILFFGQDLESFSTIGRAFNTCFLAMFGDWDWEGMKEIGYSKAAFWFLSFMLVMVLVLLNMLLAIIMDAYQVEKEKASDAITLFTQVVDMIRRRRQYKRGERVRLNDIYDTFLQEYKGDDKRMMEMKTVITAEYLVATVPKMPYKQAHRTLVNSLARWDGMKKGHPNEEDLKAEVKQGLADLERRVGAIRDDLMYIVEQLDYFDRMEASGDPTYDFYFGAKGMSQDIASRNWIHDMVTKISTDLTGIFNSGLSSINTWQDDFECDQSNLHSIVSEMHSLVRLQGELVSNMSEAVAAIRGPNEEGSVPLTSTSAAGLPSTG